MVSSQFYLESVAAHPERYMILCHLNLREVSSELVDIHIYIYIYRYRYKIYYVICLTPSMQQTENVTGRR